MGLRRFRTSRLVSCFFSLTSLISVQCICWSTCVAICYAIYSPPKFCSLLSCQPHLCQYLSWELSEWWRTSVNHVQTSESHVSRLVNGPGTVTEWGRRSTLWGLRCPILSMYFPTAYSHTFIIWVVNCSECTMRTCVDIMWGKKSRVRSYLRLQRFIGVSAHCSVTNLQPQDGGWKERWILGAAKRWWSSE